MATQRPLTHVLLVVLLLATTAFAQDGDGSFSPGAVEAGDLGPELTARGWQLLQKRGVPPTVFSGDERDLRIVADASNALIFRLAQPHEQDARQLAWTWQLDALGPRQPEPANPDWPAAVYVAFEVDKARQGWWQRFKSGWQFRFAGLPQSGRILVYTWEIETPPDDWYPNPYIPDTAANVVLQTSASPGISAAEVRDVRADFQRAFGYEPGKIVYIAVSADGEDTRSRSVMRLRQLSLSSVQ